MTTNMIRNIWKELFSNIKAYKRVFQEKKLRNIVSMCIQAIKYTNGNKFTEWLEYEKIAESINLQRYPATAVHFLPVFLVFILKMTRVYQQH